MKTKNILKIAIFSIALFALLISPVLKTNIIQVDAVSECEKEENEGICINKGLKCTTLGEYKESSFKCTDYRNEKCCIPAPEGATQQVGQHGLHTVKVTLQEKDANEVCQVSANDWIDTCMSDGTNKFVCEMQDFLLNNGALS